MRLNPNNIYLALILALGTILRFINISRSALWHDEGFTASMIARPWVEIAGLTARDVHPPLYYYALKLWSLIWGTSPLALRSLSVFFGVGVIYLVYLLAREIFDERSARLSALFVALGPFLIRYSQEARMWMMVAFLTTLATYLLIKALKTNQKRLWIIYSLTLTAGIYTQYWAALVIPVHWLYIALKSLENKSLKPLFGISWWLSNIVGFIIFSPWVPILKNQAMRVSSGYWIQRAWFNFRSVPSTIYEFLVLRHLDPWPSLVHEGIIIILGGGGIILLLRKYKDKYADLALIFGLFLIPLYLVYFYTIWRTPIYQDRYFPFAAIAFYTTLALISLSFRKNYLRKIFTAIILTLFASGVWTLWGASPHQMNKIADLVASQYQKGDFIISGELYTYFDFNYYNKTGSKPYLLAESLDGWGETSLLYQDASILVPDLNQVTPPSGRVWLVGKTGGEYFKKVPNSWRLTDSFEIQTSAVRKYQLY